MNTSSNILPYCLGITKDIVGEKTHVTHWIQFMDNEVKYYAMYNYRNQQWHKWDYMNKSTQKSLKQNYVFFTS
jgi:hypothetical protein